MIFIIKDVTADYIEHDIVQNGGRNTHDSYYLIQYFDFVMSGQKDFSIPDLCADEYVNLFSILAKYARRKKTLEERKKVLEDKKKKAIEIRRMLSMLSETKDYMTMILKKNMSIFQTTNQKKL